VWRSLRQWIADHPLRALGLGIGYLVVAAVVALSYLTMAPMPKRIEPGPAPGGAAVIRSPDDTVFTVDVARIERMEHADIVWATVPAGGEFRARDDQIFQLPVYNAVLEDSDVGRGEVVARRSADLSFFIGPAIETSVLSKKEAEPNSAVRELLSADAELDVQMKCWPCLQNSLQASRIKYQVSTGRSTEAKFQIVADQVGDSRITFNLQSEGHELDNVSMPIRVLRDVSDAGKSALGPSTRLYVPSAAAPRPEDVPHLQLTISAGGPGGYLAIAFAPRDTKLRDALAASGHWKSERLYRSGLSQETLSVIAQSFYLEVSGLVGDLALREAYSRVGGQMNLGDGAPIVMTDGDRDKFAEVLRNEGIALYRGLFLDGEDDLEEIAIALNKYIQHSDTVPRIEIRTYGVYAPWQILHPPGPREAGDIRRFWGFQTELSVRPVTREQQGVLPPTASDDPSYVIFGRYRGDPGDEVAELSQLGFDALRRLLGVKDGNAVDVTSRDAMSEMLRQHRSDVDLIATFTHGTSGTTILPGASPIALADLLGPRLRFADKNELQPDAIYALGNDLTDEEGRLPYFPRRPIVFLNGCETGTGGVVATNDRSFPGVFITMGARAVVVTEAEIWRVFGYAFGSNLLDRLSKGESLPAALRAVRLLFLEQSNSPIGLLYSYYGPPASRLAVARN
jgi:hypothetical protein